MAFYDTGAEEPRPTREIRITCPQRLSYNPNTQCKVMSLIISMASMARSRMHPHPPELLPPTNTSIQAWERKRREKKNKIFPFIFLGTQVMWDTKFQDTVLCHC